MRGFLFLYLDPMEYFMMGKVLTGLEGILLGKALMKKPPHKRGL